MDYNGLLVTTSTPGIQVENSTNYRGVAYGTAWPLDSMEEQALSELDSDFNKAVTQDMLHSVLSDGTYAPFVLADMGLAARYVKICSNYGLSLRLMLCCTDRPFPTLKDDDQSLLLRSASLLGFDYAYSSCDFSALYSDLDPPPSEDLGMFARHLNSNGLFDDAHTLEQYIACRWRHIAENPGVYVEHEGMTVRQTDLEDSGDFLAFKVYELGIETFLTRVS